MYLRAEHILDPDDPGSFFMVGGFYTNRIRRTDGCWLISGVTRDDHVVQREPGHPARRRRARPFCPVTAISDVGTTRCDPATA